MRLAGLKRGLTSAEFGMLGEQYQTKQPHRIRWGNMTSTTLTFQADDTSMRPGHLYHRDEDGIASLTFMEDGNVFVFYYTGDCDTALPYVDLAQADEDWARRDLDAVLQRTYEMTDEELESADLGTMATDPALVQCQRETDQLYIRGEMTAQEYADATRAINQAQYGQPARYPDEPGEPGSEEFSQPAQGPSPRTWFTARSDEVARIMARDTANRRTWFIASAEETARLADAVWPPRIARWDDEETVS